MTNNIDQKTVQGFGQEWNHYNQNSLDQAEQQEVYNRYFALLPKNFLQPNQIAFDLGCGSGRWAEMVAPQVKKLVCIDASAQALAVAQTKLKKFNNVELVLASVDAIPFAEQSFDWGYSLGVLHHVPDTARAIAACVSKIKVGGPFLCYLYYGFDNRPAWYRMLWQISNIARKIIAGLPFGLRLVTTKLIALLVYWPLARLAAWLEKRGVNVSSIPLAFYRDKSFYTMQTDALDRFGTHLEQRFTQDQIKAMFTQAGLGNIEFSQEPPYWVAIGYKKD